MTFQEIISKATSKLEGWMANSLSKAGCIVLIQLHLESSPAHTMQCFQLLKSTMHHLNKINRLFLEKINSEKGLSPIVWNKVCLPKCKGGLGLRKTDAVNKAFQCKLAWKLLMEDQGLWAQSVKGKYLYNTHFFNYRKNIQIHRYGKACSAVGSS